ncbi:hypothetical protein Tco_0464808 [Tanacetum coccineum]
MLGEQLQLEMRECRTELAMQILVKQSLLSGQTHMFDDDVDEELVQDLALNEDNSMFKVNLSSVDPIYDEASPSYDSNILSEVHDHDNYLDSVGEYHEVHEMHKHV